MAITSGFWNSIDHDRLVSAEAFNELFEGLLKDGILQSVGDALFVSAFVELTITIGSGRAWFNHSWIDNDHPINLTLSNSTLSLDRIDTIVIDVDKNLDVRANDIIVVQGTPSITPVPPTLIDTDLHKQYPLADVLVGAGVTEITTIDITNRIGTDETPFATGILESLSIDILLGQWEAEFTAWMEQWALLLDDECAIANLQEQINNITPTPLSGRNLLINGAMKVCQRDSTVVVDDYNGYPGGPDRWRFDNELTGTWTLAQVEDVNEMGDVQHWWKISQEVGDADGPYEGSYMFMSQRIENMRMTALRKHKSINTPLALSFMVMTNKPGRYVLELENHVDDRHITFYYDVVYPDTSTTIQLIIPQDSDAAPAEDDINTKLSVNIWLAAGDDRNGPPLTMLPNHWSSMNGSTRAPGQTWLGGDDAYFQITDVQLEISEECTTFEELNTETELTSCQRYFEPMSLKTMFHCITTFSYPGPSTVPIAVVETGPFLSVKRRVPTLSMSISEVYINGPENSPEAAPIASSLGTNYYASRTEDRSTLTVGNDNMTVGQTYVGNITLTLDAEFVGNYGYL